MLKTGYKATASDALRALQRRSTETVAGDDGYLEDLARQLDRLLDEVYRKPGES